MSADLKVSNSISFPLDAVTQTIACIGRRGAGKTYLATMLAEQMLDAHAQIIVLDAVGNWYGLRIGADGTSKGRDIFIIGGEHGDVGIVPEAGARIARLMVEKNISAVIDISGFRQGERKRFAADFAEEFFHRKKAQRSAVHFFIEEAQLFIPQRCGPDEARMLGAFEHIVRLGRNYGIGATIISQRPQSVNKEVLSQVECLCVLQVNGTHERKALDEWVQEAGADRRLVNELPGLRRGEGYIWSPSWLRIFERVQFAKKTTFDTSATPEVGRAAKAAMLSSVDVERLKEDLAAVVKQAEADNPKVLRKRIGELERELREASKEATKPTSIDPQVVAALESRIRELETYSGDLARTNDRLREGIKAFETLREPLETCAQAIRAISATVIPAPGNFKLPVSPTTSNLVIKRPTANPTTFRNKAVGSMNGVSKELRAGARRMLGCLCQWYPAGRTEAQLAAQVQMKKTGGTWAAYKSDLRGGGYIEVRSDGLWYATEVGRDYLGADIPDAPSTTEGVVELWGSKLRKGAREMLDVLVRRGGRSMSRAELGEAVAMEPSGGTFAAYLTDLRQAGLIATDRGEVRANKETLLL